jgi:hypothetical protein
LHDRRECWERGLKGALGHALKTSLTQAERTQLEGFMNTLPADAEADAERVGLVSSQM